jgi:hypothetical protein
VRVPELFNRKAVCAGLLLWCAGIGASAQQVHVFSDGKPFPDVDAGNAARPRAPDERKARRPLSERPDALGIASAHAAAFLHCGLDESHYPPEQTPAREQLDYFVNAGSYVPIPGTGKIIVLGEFERGKAVLDSANFAVLTPQCPAGVRTMFWSHNAGRVVFATQHVDKMDFHGNSRALWTARYHPAQDLFLMEAAHPEAAMRQFMRLPDEKVLDVLVPDSGEALWILSASEKLDLRSPKKWWRAISRDPARKMTILLRKVDLQGKTIEQTTVATGVAAGAAVFVRE